MTPESDSWAALLPASRHAFDRQPADQSYDATVTYGDYFKATRDFLLKNDLALLRRALSRSLERPIEVSDLEGVSVYLVKHGAFYHPALIEVAACGQRLPMVLNVAVSTEGQRILPREFQSLIQLNAGRPRKFWPDVFGQGVGVTPGGRQLPMFLGQWLEGFSEFHLTVDPASGDQGVVVWDAHKGHWMLTQSQIRQVLSQAACILAYAYNPLTFYSILNWHHAAGDFVIGTAADGPAVGLITVRNYAPFVKAELTDVTAMLDTLLVFLVGTSLRLRLDRLDGTGPVACYPPDVVPAIWQGFSQGIQMAAPLHDLPDDFDQTVRQYMALHSVEDLTEVATAIIDQYPSASDENVHLRAEVQDHVAALCQAIGR